MLSSEPVKSLVQSLLSPAAPAQHPDNTLKQLVIALQKACAGAVPAVSSSQLEPYPVEADGYARAFCPITEPDEFMAVWQRYGVVVGRQILDPAQCSAAQKRVDELLQQLDGGKQMDANGTPALSRGFLEIYHDAALADIRQNLKFYLHHVLVWQQAELWCSFDRLGVKPPEGESAGGLPLHVDQNPLVHSGFRTTQGVLALADCLVERGTFKVVAGSRAYFNAYATMAKNNGEYVELDSANIIASVFESRAQALALRAGDMVTWDSRTTHANTANVSGQTRYVAYVSAGPAQWGNAAAVQARQQAFINGMGSNVREALMHASKKPRFTAPDTIAALREPEQLNQLGRYLYGQEPYPSAA